MECFQLQRQVRREGGREGGIEAEIKGRAKDSLHILPSSLFHRYWGFAAADVFIPGPTYSSVTATEMENFYGDGWNRRYKVLGARSREVAKVRSFPSFHSCFPSLFLSSILLLSPFPLSFLISLPPSSSSPSFFSPPLFPPGLWSRRPTRAASSFSKRHTAAIPAVIDRSE